MFEGLSGVREPQFWWIEGEAFNCSQETTIQKTNSTENFWKAPKMVLSKV